MTKKTKRSSRKRMAARNPNHRIGRETFNSSYYPINPLFAALAAIMGFGLRRRSA